MDNLLLKAQSQVRDYEKAKRQQTRIVYLVNKFGHDLASFREDWYIYYLRDHNTVKISVYAASKDENERRFFVDSKKLEYEDKYGITWDARPHKDYSNSEAVEYTGEAASNGVTLVIDMANAPVPPSCRKVFKGFQKRETAIYEIVCNETGASV